MSDVDRLSLLRLIDRWHHNAQYSESDEADQARRDLENRINILAGYVAGMAHYSPAAERLVQLIEGKS
jgi:hypothetical protein